MNKIGQIGSQINRLIEILNQEVQKSSIEKNNWRINYEQQRAAEIQQINNKYQSDTATLRSSICRLEKEVEVLERKNRQIEKESKQQVDSLLLEIEALRNKKFELSRKNSLLEKDIKASVNNHEELIVEVRYKDEVILNQKKTIQYLEDTILKSESQMKSDMNEMTLLRDKINDRDQTISAIKLDMNEITLLQDGIDDLKQTISDMTEKNLFQELEHNKLRKNYDVEKLAKQKLEENINDLNTILNQKDILIEGLTDKISNLESEVSKAIGEFNKISSIFNDKFSVQTRTRTKKLYDDYDREKLARQKLEEEIKNLRTILNQKDILFEDLKGELIIDESDSDETLSLKPRKRRLIHTGGF